MTMVLGDNQDFYLGQLRRQDNRPYYLTDGKQQPTHEHQETFFIKDQRPIHEVIHETRHGPLFNGTLGEHKDILQPLSLKSGYELAHWSIQQEIDKILDGSFDLPQARAIEQASDATREIRAMPPNIVFVDEEHIGWQVIGRYPNRKEGRGLLPSPGWGGRYDQDGYAGLILHPSDQDPQQGWLGTANHRTVQLGYNAQLSNSWYYPERVERIVQLAGASKSHDTQNTIRMQYDQTSLFVVRPQTMFDNLGMAASLCQAIDALPGTQRSRAQEAYDRLMAFDGKLTVGSSDAALYDTSLYEGAKQIFLDELGPEDDPVWKAFIEVANLPYSAQADHLFERDGSPFRDNTHTLQKEGKLAILARSLAVTMEFCEQRLRSEHEAWQWGKLYTYEWRNGSSKMAPYLGAGEHAGFSVIKGYFDRGLYPVGGDHTTLGVPAYGQDQDLDTWPIPTMRLIIDLGQGEPMIGVNGSGQSGNPASPHYVGGTNTWFEGRYVSFPFQPQNLGRVCDNEWSTLTPVH